MADVPVDLVAALLPEAVFRWRPSPGEDAVGTSAPNAQVESTVSVTALTLKEGCAEAVLRLRWVYTILEPGAEPFTRCEEGDVTINLGPGGNPT